MGYLLVILILVPLVELGLLIKVGQHFGAVNTILLVILTGVAGAWLAKYQGLRVLWEIRSLLSRGVMPGYKLVEGLLVLLGGLLLLTPGFVTDVLGLLCLLPVSRPFLAGLVIRMLENYLRSGRVRIYRF
ncbi:MAG TPA: FxsA family protein [Clostridia bacterium]|nr:FxsA family protein [Clostridia bacterium]